MGARSVRLRCECRRILCRLRRGDGIHSTFTPTPLPGKGGGLPRVDWEESGVPGNWRVTCRCGRVHLLGRDQQEYARVVRAAWTLGRGDVYLEDIPRSAVTRPRS